MIGTSPSITPYHQASAPSCLQPMMTLAPTVAPTLSLASLTKSEALCFTFYAWPDAVRNGEAMRFLEWLGARAGFMEQANCR